MTAKELKVIHENLWAAQRSIEYLACENYPRTEFEDEDFRDMFYALNNMLLDIDKKMDALERKEQNT